MGRSDYDVFISYARSVSTPLAIDLQHELERFAKKWNQVRAVRVFRDDSSMSANTGLWSTIESALTTARYLILIATPESAASEYVGNEVRWWLEHKGAESILLVLAGGRLTWDRVGGGFTPDSVVPPVLQHAFPEEPRWIDVTWYGQPGSAGASDPRFQERVADLSAPVRGVDRDALIGANLAEHRKTMRRARFAIATLATLLVAALIAGGVAVAQRNTAKKLFADSVGQRIAPEAARILNGEIPGGPGRGLQQLLIAEQLKTVPNQGAYLNAMIATAGIQKITTTTSPMVAAIGPNLIATSNVASPGDIQTWDTELQPVGLPIQTGNESLPKAISHDGKLLAAANSSGVVTLWDMNTRARKGSLRIATTKGPDSAFVTNVMFTPDDRGLVVRAGDNTIRFYASDSLQQTAPEIPETAWLSHPRDGQVIAVAPLRGTAVEIRDPWTGNPIGEPLKLSPISARTDPSADPVDDIPKLFFNDCRSFDGTGNRLLVKNKVYDLKTRAPVDSWDRISGLDCADRNMAMNDDGSALIEGGDSIQISKEGDGSPSKQLTSGGPFPGVVWLDHRRAFAITREGMLALAFDPWGLNQASRAAFGGNEGDIAVQSPASKNVDPCSSYECVVAFHDGSALRPARPIEGTLAGGANESFYTVDLQDRNWNEWNFQDGSLKRSLRLVDDVKSGVCNVIGDPETQSMAVSTHAGRDAGFCERGGGTIRSWDLSTGQQRPDLKVPDDVQIISFPDIDGSKLTAFARRAKVSGDAGSIWTFDLNEGTSRMEYDFDQEVAFAGKCRSESGGTTWMIAETSGDVGFVKGDLTQGLTWPKARTQSDLNFGFIKLVDDCRIGASWGDFDGDSLQFWDVGTGTPLGNPILDAAVLTFDDRGFMGVRTGGNLGSLRIMPVRPTAKDLCAKLTFNMSRKQWDEWISPDIEYQKACPELPILPNE